MGRFEAAPVPQPRGAAAEWGMAHLENAGEWARGRNWIVRAPLLLYLAYGFVRHLFDPLYSTFLFGGVTFGVHELGHPLFSFLGTFMMFSGGSLAQLLAPAAIIFGFLRQEDYFAISVGGAWMSFSLFNLATYIGDARARELPLLGLTDDPQHDWHYILSKTGLLSLDTTLAFLTRVTAFGLGLAALALGAWVCWQMRRR